VASLDTDPNGVIRGKVQGVSANVNNKFITLIPMINQGTPAKAVTGGNMGEGLWGWVCGSTLGASITDLEKKYLPGSCRG
jgi:hypothetical protein